MKSIRVSPTAIISVCDEPDNEIIVNGRVWRFDFYRYFGPTWLKKNGEIRKCQNPKKAVWKAFGKWFDQYHFDRWKKNQKKKKLNEHI
jgi:hypothetical protein